MDLSPICTTGCYAFFAWRLWQETRRQATTAAQQAATAQQMLNAAHRPWLSIDVYADVGTGPKVINIASEDATLGLPEIKLGLLPLIVMAPVLRAAGLNSPWCKSVRDPSPEARVRP